MENKAIIEKVQKLLSLASSDNKHEAELAMKNAEKLMVKYNLDMQSVKGHSSEYVNNVAFETNRNTCDNKYICMLLEKFFFIKVVRSIRRTRNGSNYRSTNHYHFIGEKSNVEIAAYTYDYLSRQFKKAYKDYCKAHGNIRGGRESFYIGLYRGLNDKLTEARHQAEQEYGLVLVEDPNVSKFMNKEFPKISSSSLKLRNINDNVKNAGYKKGKSMSLNAGINSGMADKKIS